MKTDFKTLHITLDNGVALFELDNPPVNQLSAGLREEMAAAFASAFSDDAVKAIVITGTGEQFIAGADITEISTAGGRDELLGKVLDFDAFYNTIEKSPKAVVAAINGPALGGGLEMAMACHYRIAAQGIQLAQPEVRLGLIPGAGGTQRLPRLCGLPDALEMITTGKMISAEQGLDKGILDEVVSPEAIVTAAVTAARRFIAGEDDHLQRMTCKRTNRLPAQEEKEKIIQVAEKTAYQKARGLLAPFKAIEAMKSGLTDDFDADIKVEAALFTDCAVSDIAKNLIGIFLNTRNAGRLLSLKGITPAPINTVAMLGLGVMGSGIANMLLRACSRAIFWEVDEDCLEAGRKRIKKTFSFAIKKGEMAEEDLDRLLGEKAVFTTRLGDISDADLVIEAVLENMTIKKDVWKKAEGICRPEAVFATNTSALSITELAGVLTDPGRMLGYHFFNPAERMQLVEIVRGKATRGQTLATIVGFSRKIKKVPVVVNDGPGFYTSRQLNALMGESNFMLEEGIELALIDKALVAFGMPMGAFTLYDLTGIDIGFHVASYFEQSFGERWRVSELHKRIFKTGCYGRKTGSGYYDYSGETPVPNPKVTEVINAYLKEKKIAVKDASPKELADRMLARAINEAAYMMEEGICDNRPADMDLAMVYGCGYPAHRGGVFRDADNWGIDEVCRYLEELAVIHGPRYRPAGLLKSMAESGRKFY